MTRRIDALLSEYGESHRNETNKAVHWVCVPAIVWSLMALLWSFPVPAFLASVPGLNWLTLLLVPSLVYYLLLSWPLAIGFVVFTAACIAVIQVYLLWSPLPLWQFAIAVFAIAWIGQFWGHKIEGKKPSFFKDVQFLLIGPAWLMSFIYKRLGLAY